jgi:hypothetical protein
VADLGAVTLYVVGSYSASMTSGSVTTNTPDAVNVINPTPLQTSTPTPTPPPVTVTSVQWETIQFKVGTGKHAKTKSETALDVQYSGNVSGSGDLAAYQLSSVTTKKVKKKAVTSYKPIRLTSALPASSPMASSVLLVPATKPNLSQIDRLQIVAADLTDALGRPLGGTDDGQPSGDYTVTFGRTGVAADALSLAQTPAPSSAVPTAIDALLARGELAGARREPRSARG